MPRHEKIFLSAEWRDLLMLNYELDPAILRKYLPAGTELDSFSGKTHGSLVGFRFCRTKLLGVLPIPFHTEFEEINLRFYEFGVERNREDAQEFCAAEAEAYEAHM